MKNTLLVLVCISSLLFVSCRVDDNDMGDRATKKWNELMQKDLIGNWQPKIAEIQLLDGEPILQGEWPVDLPDCKNDVLTFNQDYTGVFNSYLDECNLNSKPLTWSHKLGEITVLLDDGTKIRTLLLHKSGNKLVVLIALNDIIPEIFKIIPSIEYVDPELLSHFYARITFVKE